jgi:hypothetical protein
MADTCHRTKTTRAAAGELGGGTEKKVPAGMVQLAFGGCGGMYNYFLGVASIIQQEFELGNVLFSGASAGCFPALLLALDLDIQEEFDAFNIPLLDETRTHALKAFGSWIPLTRKHTLERLAPDAYKVAGKRCFFSATEVPRFRNHLLTNFESNEDMVDSMCASGYVSMYADHVALPHRGTRFVDGCLTNNSPLPHAHLPSKVLQIWSWRWVSPTWALIYTDEAWCRQLFEWGKEDCLKHLDELAEVLTKKDRAESGVPSREE